MTLVRAGHAIALAAFLFAGPLMAPAANADAPGTPEARFSATLVARHSDKCLDVYGGSTRNGADVIQWTCTGGLNQDWSLVATDSGYYTIEAAHSGKCLDVYGGSTRNGADAIQWTCAGTPNQQWKLVQEDDGYFSVVARHSGKCLDVYGGGTSDGADVIQWTCAGTPNQQWRLA
ncbi:RICIN domain-containing protein [Streptosporangium sp. CA-135522]|uniref:RICIN domain-containing protein n=1 Tax=Streptosporangium sp. CA-135522 TaxID=3240072 RepID=UPI003D91D3E2